MDSDIRSSVRRFVQVMIVTMLVCISYNTYQYNKIYNSIQVTTIDSATIEYGSAKYDIDQLVDKVDGTIISIKKDVDTTKVGIQEMVVEVEKDNIIKEVSIQVEIKDTIAPEIQLKETKLSIEQGESIDLLNNLESVFDEVDGQLEYQTKENVHDDIDTNYYTIVSSVDTNRVGTYIVTIKAVDKYGNISTCDYQVDVKEKPIVEVSKPVIHNNPISTVNTGSLVSIAYSLVGSPYSSGGNSPAGFDCSGFVQYVYAQVGISISRSSSTQINDGIAVSYENAMPGDILSWGYVDGSPTHSAIYVGNGQMIHSTNPRQGVIVSDIAAWTRGSGTHVIAVRRI